MEIAISILNGVYYIVWIAVGISELSKSRRL